MNLITADHKREQMSSPCEQCGRAGAKNRCVHCLGVFYCDVGCQQRHWRSHKPACRRQQPAPAGVDAAAFAQQNSQAGAPKPRHPAYSLGGVPVESASQVLAAALLLLEAGGRADVSNVSQAALDHVTLLRTVQKWLFSVEADTQGSDTCRWRISLHIRALAMHVEAMVAAATETACAAFRPHSASVSPHSASVSPHSAAHSATKAAAAATEAAAAAMAQAVEQGQVAADLCLAYSRLAPAKSLPLFGRQPPPPADLWAIIAPAQVLTQMALFRVQNRNPLLDKGLLQVVQREALAASLSGFAEISRDLEALALYYQMSCMKEDIKMKNTPSINVLCKYYSFGGELAKLVAQKERHSNLYDLYRGSLCLL